MTAIAKFAGTIFCVSILSLIISAHLTRQDIGHESCDTSKHSAYDDEIRLLAAYSIIINGAP